MEFALILPVLLIMIGGTLQSGVLMFTYNMMVNSARDGARRLSVGSGNEAAVKTAMKSTLPPWVADSSWTVDAQDIATTGTNQVNASISVPSAKATVLPLAPMPATLTVRVVMLKET